MCAMMQILRVNRLPMWKRHYCLAERLRQPRRKAGRQKAEEEFGRSSFVKVLRIEVRSSQLAVRGLAFGGSGSEGVLSSVFCLLSSVFCLLSSVFCLLSSVFCLLFLSCKKPLP